MVKPQGITISSDRKSVNDARDIRAEVISTDEIAADFYVTKLRSAHMATARPGQFVNVRVRDSMDPFLRIPLSVAAVDVEGGTFDVMYEDMGPKSHFLRSVTPGMVLSCLGPLGNSFPSPLEGQCLVLVAGGIGLPPVLYHGRELVSAGCTDVRLLVGARSADKLVAEERLRDAATATSIATEDGSAGFRGFVTNLLAKELESLTRPPLVCSCGPHGMLAAVASICVEQSIPCYVSLEEYMACGIGICVGCVVERSATRVNEHSPYHQYSRICVDGPVYDATEVGW